MKKFFTILLILIILAAGGFYYFKNRDDSQFRCESGYRFVPSTQTCEPVNKDEKDGIDFSKVKLNIPGTNYQLDLFKDLNSNKYTGKYEDSNNVSNSFYVDLDEGKLVEFSEQLVLVPFIINSGGTGQFLYVGLFDSTQNTHLSSAFIGDRTSISNISVVDNKVKINFLTRLDSESFSESPSIPAQIVLEIKDNSMNLIMGLQNADYSDVEIKSPLGNSEIGENLLLKGAIPGSWYFEAVAHYQILDNQNKEIAFGYFEALSDWMTTQRVPFEVNITSSNLNYKGGATLIIKSDNPEGGEEGERKMKKIFIPIVFK